jgi:hypothetical protein
MTPQTELEEHTSKLETKIQHTREVLELKMCGLEVKLGCEMNAMRQDMRWGFGGVAGLVILAAILTSRSHGKSAWTQACTRVASAVQSAMRENIFHHIIHLIHLKFA